MNKLIDPRIDEVIKFWFEETAPEQKFKVDNEFDELIKSRFLWLFNEIVEGELSNWKSTPRWILAKIIVIDQFSRNMLRWNKKSFEHDELALELATIAIDKGLDKELPYEYRSFLYMPFMHSESKEVHKEALRIFTDYGNEVNLKFEIKHKEIIDKFWRYPHRNEVLWRESTLEEIEFLKTHSGF